MLNDKSLEQFAQEVKALQHKKNRSICEYCGCEHPIRLSVYGPDYLLESKSDACHQYIRDIHSEIRAIKIRLALPIEG